MLGCRATGQEELRHGFIKFLLVIFPKKIFVKFLPITFFFKGEKSTNSRCRMKGATWTNKIVLKTGVLDNYKVKQAHEKMKNAYKKPTFLTNFTIISENCLVNLSALCLLTVRQTSTFKNRSFLFSYLL